MSLERDIRDDDAEPLIAAIRQMRGVLDVQAHVSDVASWTAEERARLELRTRILEVLRKPATSKEREP